MWENVFFVPVLPSPLISKVAPAFPPGAETILLKSSKEKGMKTIALLLIDSHPGGE